MNRRSSSWICWIIAVLRCGDSGSCRDVAGHPIVRVENDVVSKIGLYLWCVPGAMADILIVVAMTPLSRRAIGKFSNFVLIRVIRLTVETNTLTAVVILVLYVAFPVTCTEIRHDSSFNSINASTEYFAYPGSTTGNTLLVSLNNRIYFRDHKPPGHGDSAFVTVSSRHCIIIAPFRRT
ncbi:hypothetical protein BJY52DRAFT_1215388 [Lactarius psammicola]|nr:hypothetical protein BJY52DRAFT_1215388 [Lactarius psammicola]